eukprot:TRINITY_DN24966_c0_g2_i1.p1 TRINITY_DN24966_c0_g2~~TRINITY_DN24966_c0_g2_i1.p1  ORF type:complete len:576 (-),score=64.86 TRINITY_DN24966_c0_g2_i1:53-1678(-)
MVDCALSTPIYDVCALSLLPLGAPANVQSFLGPVEVRFIAGKGRGLAVTRDVEAGELLFVDKAFAVAERSALTQVSVEKLSCCSCEEYDAFFLLCDGRRTPAELPVLLSRRNDSDCFDNAQERKKIAAQSRNAPRKRVQAILSANAHELDTADLATGRAASQSQPRLSGLFLVGSLVNHSCLPSALRLFFGDTMFVRAARSLRKGEEVTDAYISVLHPSFERLKMLEEGYGFRVLDDRALVDDALMPEVFARPLLDRFDKSERFEDFVRLAADVETLVWERMALLNDGLSDAILHAATRLSPGLDRTLCGGFLAIFVGVAVLAQSLGRYADAATAFARCCRVMEGTAPHNAYHVGWAADAVLSASMSREASNLADHVRYARKVFRIHYGDGAFEILMAKRGVVVSVAALGASLGEAILPPDTLVCRVSKRWRRMLPSAVCVDCDSSEVRDERDSDVRSEEEVVVEIKVGNVRAKDVLLEVGRRVVRVRSQNAWSVIVLPGPIRADATHAAYFVRGSGKLRLALPLEAELQRCRGRKLVVAA